MIDLCKIFGVEEGEEFKINIGEAYYTISCNELFYYDEHKEEWFKSCKPITINDLPNLNIIKLPKKKEFTDDELCILRNINKEYKWITRTRGDVITLHDEKPFKDHDIWNSRTIETAVNVFNHLFQSIQWEDEEPVFIDDYVERGAK